MRRLRLSILSILTAVWLPAAGLCDRPVQNDPSGTALDQGLWWLYHLQYDQARKKFDEYTAANPKDPAGYFYKTASDWWQLAQQFDKDLPEIVERMEKDYQDTVRVAQELLDSQPDHKTKGLAYMYMGGAQGLKGRWLVTQRQWVDAYFMGRKGHKMLKRALVYNPDLYDVYMGLGIYDYFTDTLSGAQKILAALLIHGDRERGLKELHLAIDKGQHARVEAMMFLIEIYTWEEDTPEKALPLAQQLHQEFPKSPAMELAEIMDYYELKQWDKVSAMAQDYLEKSEKESPHYTHEGVFPARYCLGVAALWGQKDPDTCLKYMKQIVGEEQQKSSRWVTFAYLRMGQVYDLKGEREKALECYKTVLGRRNFWGSHNEANAYTKQPFRYPSI
jgi:tetratricopeptide (TPR) repeat protein